MKLTTLHGNTAKTTPLHINNSETDRIAGSFYFQGSKPEAQHTRKTR